MSTSHSQRQQGWIPASDWKNIPLQGRASKQSLGDRPCQLAFQTLNPEKLTFRSHVKHERASIEPMDHDSINQPAQRNESQLLRATRLDADCIDAIFQWNPSLDEQSWLEHWCPYQAAIVIESQPIEAELLHSIEEIQESLEPLRIATDAPRDIVEPTSVGPVWHAMNMPSGMTYPVS